MMAGAIEEVVKKAHDRTNTGSILGLVWIPEGICKVTWLALPRTPKLNYQTIIAPPALHIGDALEPSTTISTAM
jgi:hypothetical protein